MLGHQYDYRTTSARTEGPWSFFSAGPDDTVYSAIKKMADENVVSLVVIERGKLIGMIH